MSIPQHLRDRGIAVIRPRGRKLAGLWERKPRLEEAAGESEWRIVIASKPGEDTEKEERGKEKHTHRTEERAEEQQGTEGQTADLRQDTPALQAVLQGEDSCPTRPVGGRSVCGSVPLHQLPANPHPASLHPASHLPVVPAWHCTA